MSARQARGLGVAGAPMRRGPMSARPSWRSFGRCCVRRVRLLARNLSNERRSPEPASSAQTMDYDSRRQTSFRLPSRPPAASLLPPAIQHAARRMFGKLVLADRCRSSATALARAARRPMGVLVRVNRNAVEPRRCECGPARRWRAGVPNRTGAPGRRNSGEHSGRFAGRGVRANSAADHDRPVREVRRWRHAVRLPLASSPRPTPRCRVPSTHRSVALPFAVPQKAHDCRCAPPRRRMTPGLTDRLA